MEKERKERQTEKVRKNHKDGERKNKRNKDRMHFTMYTDDVTITTVVIVY